MWAPLEAAVSWTKLTFAEKIEVDLAVKFVQPEGGENTKGFQ